tara:strand:+ start:1753 stop:2259 length:507 start_codon:yes stop_codon:yes gene_type:complete
MMLKKKKPKHCKTSSDHGPIEKLQHGTHVEIETRVPGVTALRNITADPIATYRARGSISIRQHVAADRFAGEWRAAALGAVYASVRFGTVRGGDMPDDAAYKVARAKERVRGALEYVGFPLAGVIEHVVGDGMNAGSWAGVQTARRADRDGMVALRLALDGLVMWYQV